MANHYFRVSGRASFELSMRRDSNATLVFARPDAIVSRADAHALSVAPLDPVAGRASQDLMCPLERRLQHRRDHDLRLRRLSGRSVPASSALVTLGTASLVRRRLIAEWESWAEGAGSLPSSQIACRQEALRRLVAYLSRLGGEDSTLDLSYLGLSGMLPSLPLQLGRLDVSGNPELCALSNLPALLTQLKAEHCGLVALPPWPAESGLRKLNVNGNALLRALPSLPPLLEELYAQDCDLVHLAPFAPDSPLKKVFLSGNHSLQQVPPLPRSLVIFHASRRGLQRVPAFASDVCLEGLFLDENQLDLCPELPPGLRVLVIGGNPHLCSLPKLNDALEVVRAERCGLSSLPVLGPQLRLAAFQGNPIQGLACSESVPEVLRQGGAALSNGLTDALADWVWQVHPSLELLLSTTHLDATTRQAFAHWQGLQSTGHAGGSICFDPEQTANSMPQRPKVHVRRHASESIGLERPHDLLNEAWRSDDQSQAKPDWPTLPLAFANEEGAQAFELFLFRMSFTINYEGFGSSVKAQLFRNRVESLLRDMALSSDLRQACYAISQEALSSCEDRIILSFHQMAIPRLSEAVRRGVYRDQLSSLITHIRRRYRIEILSEIAERKIALMQRVDPVEVHLAYQVGLNEALDLRLDADSMRFFKVCGVTQDDFLQAKAEVQQRENQDFGSYLIHHSEPWQFAVKDLDSDIHKQLMELKFKSIDGLFDVLNQRLGLLGLQGDADAEREMAVQITQELSYEAQLPVVEDFLKAQGLDPSIVTGPHWKAA